MTDNGNGSYGAEIPAAEAIVSTEYYFKLINDYYDWQSPVNAPDTFYNYYTGPDENAPDFNHAGLISIINGEVDREILVGILDDGLIDTNSVYIHFSSKTFADSAKLHPTDNPVQFSGIIPANFAYGDTVTYYFKASDKAQAVNTGISDTYSFVVGIENFETGLGGWITTPNGWDIDDLYPHSGNYSISDSPGQSPYPSNRWAIIMTNFNFDLSNCTHATLTFWTKYYLEISSDYGYVEVSTNGGALWHPIGSPLNGFNVSYHQQSVSLDDYCGPGNTNVKLRFRMTSDNQQTAPVPGWFIDDIQIIEGKDVSQVAESSAKPVLPKVFKLFQNYPNPFNPRTTIRFDLPEPAEVSLTIFNIRGEIVRTWVDKNFSAGIHKMEWDGKNNNKLPLTTGVYFYRLSTPKFSSVKKLILLK